MWGNNNTKQIWLSCILIIFIGSLAACGGNKDAANIDTKENDVPVTQVDADDSSNNDSDSNETEDVVDDTDTSSEAPNDAVGVLKKNAEAMSTLSGMALQGSITSVTDFMGIVSDEVSDVTGTYSLNPLAQHMTINSDTKTDGMTESTVMESYLTDEGMFIQGGEADGWISMPTEQSAELMDLSAVISEVQINVMANSSLPLNLEEDDENYLISISGSGDEFKEVVFGSMKELGGQEAYDVFADLIAEISGTYEFIIAKDTFYTVGLKTDIKQTMDMGVGEVISDTQTNYQYSDFGNVEAVTVPADVVENAQSMEDLMGN